MILLTAHYYVDVLYPISEHCCNLLLSISPPPLFWVTITCIKLGYESFQALSQVMVVLKCESHYRIGNKAEIKR